jgi:hypothetical protein
MVFLRDIAFLELVLVHLGNSFAEQREESLGYSESKALKQGEDDWKQGKKLSDPCRNMRIWPI